MSAVLPPAYRTVHNTVQQKTARISVCAYVGGNGRGVCHRPWERGGGEERFVRPLTYRTAAPSLLQDITYLRELGFEAERGLRTRAFRHLEKSSRVTCSRSTIDRRAQYDVGGLHHAGNMCNI